MPNFRTLIFNIRLKNPYRAIRQKERKMTTARNPGYKRVPRHYLKSSGYKLLSVDEENVEATVSHPGLTFTDYDVYGQPKIWQMMNLVVSARMYAHHVPLDETGRTFRDYEKLTSDFLTFLVTSEVCFTKELYNHEVPKNSLISKVRGGYIGNTSMNSLTSVSSDSGALLITNINQVVSIDKDSRRPKPLPEWWKNKYAEVAKNCKALKLESFSRPHNTGIYKVKVAWSDTDMNNHTTWSAYVRFAKDAAHHCAREGTLPKFEEKLTEGVEKIQSHYLGECLEGDELVVYVWEDIEKEYKLRVHIDKDDRCIFQCILSFF